MMKRLMNKKKYLAVLVPLLATTTVCAEGLKALDDEQMSAQTGQALLNLSYIAPTDAANIETTRSGGDNNTGFYKLGIEAEMELNANIKNLQLGCGGVNGAGACDIDIKNLSLSGLNDGVETGENAGSPTFSDGRPATSAKLTNPFIEFAIKNPDSAAGREMVGFRLSAESIEGLLSAGLENLDSPSATDGIQTLSGYMQVAGTTGDVNTVASTFGRGTTNCLPKSGGGCQAIGGKVDTAFGARNFRSLVNNSNTTGITVPSLEVDFTLPAFTINGRRQTQAVVNGVSSTIPWLPLAAAGDCPTEYAAACADANAQIEDVDFDSDQLYVELTRSGDTTNWEGQCIRVIFCVVTNTKFGMADGSAITDLNVDITFEQALSMFHNIPLKGTGGYLSLQKQALRWPGANDDDVAQRGWWMSFAEPVDLGYLQAQNDVDISAVLPQVAEFVTDSLLAGEPIDVSSLGDSWSAITNQVLRKKLIIDVSSSPAAKLTLQNQQLRSQGVVSNCWGNMTMGC